MKRPKFKIFHWVEFQEDDKELSTQFFGSNFYVIKLSLAQPHLWMTFRRLVFRLNSLKSSLFSGQVSNHSPFLWPFPVHFLSFSVSGLHLKVSVIFLRPPRSTAACPKPDWVISKSYLTGNRLQFNSLERSNSWSKTTSNLQKEFWTNPAILKSMLQGDEQANHPSKFFMLISTTIDFSMTLPKPSSITPTGCSFFPPAHLGLLAYMSALFLQKSTKNLHKTSHLFCQMAAIESHFSKLQRQTDPSSVNEGPPTSTADNHSTLIMQFCVGHRFGSFTALLPIMWV